jgi:hypothetical protein
MSASLDSDQALVPSAFGVAGIDIYTVSWADFRPHDSSVGYTSDTGVGTGGFRWTTAGTEFLHHGVEGIPNGAVLTQVNWYIRDTNVASNFTGFLCRYWRDSGASATGGGGDASGDCISTVSSNTSAGDAGPFENLTHTIQRRHDADVDGTIEVVNYVLFSQTPGLDGSVKVGLVRLLWHRQVSPDPVTATFLDVPVGHGQHQFVEALARAGITAGCGGGNFCPLNPVTRGQMAVFLSLALGLHWPAF